MKNWSWSYSDTALFEVILGRKFMPFKMIVGVIIYSEMDWNTKTDSNVVAG